MIQTVYKVVRTQDEGVFMSAAVTEAGAQLRYRIGYATKPLHNSIGIFVFVDREQARVWCDFWRHASGNHFSGQGYYVMECDAVDPMVPQRVGKFYEVMRTLEVFTKSKASFSRRVAWSFKKFSHIFFKTPPAGTMVTSRVTPLKFVG